MRRETSLSLARDVRRPSNTRCRALRSPATDVAPENDPQDVDPAIDSTPPIKEIP